MDQDYGVGREVKRLREARKWSQSRLAVEADMSVSGVSMIENGHRNLSTTTLGKLAKALGIEVADLFPKAQSSSPEPSFDDVLDDERRASWGAAVAEGQRLRDTERARRMWRAVNNWRASEQRGEPKAARREYLDEMGNLLQEAYSAYTALGNAYIEAALTHGGSEASVPSYLQAETQAANDFYVEMFGLVSGARLTIHRGAEAAAAKHAAETPAAGRPHSVQEAG